MINILCVVDIVITLLGVAVAEDRDAATAADAKLS
jgi:hypothetical protein